jgi:serine/threonine protein kinase
VRPPKKCPCAHAFRSRLRITPPAVGSSEATCDSFELPGTVVDSQEVAQVDLFARSKPLPFSISFVHPLQALPFTFISAMGSGTHGVVFKALSTSSQDEVAVKVVHTNGAIDTAHVILEAKMLSVVKSRGIVALRSVHVTALSDVLIATDLHDGGDLDSDLFLTALTAKSLLVFYRIKENLSQSLLCGTGLCSCSA